MGKLADALRREQERESAAEADKIVSGGNAEGRGAFTGEIARRNREETKQQEDALREALRKIRGPIGKDDEVAANLWGKYKVSDLAFWGAVKAERAARNHGDKSDTQEAESRGGDPGFIRQPKVWDS